MEKKLISKCPVCGDKMKVTSLKCVACSTEVKGQFSLNKLSKLTEEQLQFIEIFIKCRGNIKEVEREMDISYPTVRNKLDEVTAALGYSVKNDSDEKVSRKRQEILDMLEKGEIDPEKASDLLKNQS